MSIKLFGEDVLFLQRFLKGTGFYTAKLDGSWGEKTDAASSAFEEETMKIANILGKFDPRSEKAIGQPSSGGAESCQSIFEEAP